MTKIRTLFIGTGNFALPVLKHLLQNPHYDVAAVITQPDRPAGRAQKLQPSAVKQLLSEQKSSIELLQPEKLATESASIISEYVPELVVVASYGQMLPRNLLDYPKFKCVNFHASLLPKLRGAVPVPMAILEGFNETGVSMQIMTEGLDEGDVIASRKYALDRSETSESLMRELSELAGAMVDQELLAWNQGNLTPMQQDDRQATYCYRDDSSKAKAEIVFTTGVERAERMVRAFYPWPVAWILLKDGRRLKIFEAMASQLLQASRKELALVVEDKKLFLVLLDGVLELNEVQLEGRKRGNAREYLYLGA